MMNKFEKKRNVWMNVYLTRKKIEKTSLSVYIQDEKSRNKTMW
jgi:hypothetical protein